MFFSGVVLIGGKPFATEALRAISITVILRTLSFLLSCYLHFLSLANLDGLSYLEFINIPGKHVVS